MFLGAPLAYKLLVDRDCLTYGNTQYLADKIQSAKEYKDMCRTLCIQKIYTERISYLIFWVNLTDHNVDQLLSQSKNLY